MNMKILAAVAFIAVGCMFFAPGQQQPKYRKTWCSVLVPGPTPFSNGMVDERPAMERVIDGGDCMLYEIDRMYAYFEENVLIRDTVYCDLFAYQKSKPYGYKLSTLSDTFGRSLPVDSMLKKHTVKFEADISTELINTALASAEQLDENRMVKRYAVSHKGYDSAYYYYDRRLMDIPYSFSPIYDSIHQSKLYKIELLVKKAQRVHDITGKDFKWNILEMGTAPVESEQTLDSFFARLRKHEIKEIK
jgi:hypothetical protein